ncbi:unnamed protein product [Peniophora sp. CBMAI 1063]|nr:unnamed protein product [Peniophora sp. CBMAI 1063]
MAAALDATEDVRPCDALEVLDVSGPIWVSSHTLSILKMFNVHSTDVVRILSHNRNITVLSVRLHLPWSLEVPPAFPWPSELQEPVSLPLLSKVHIAGVISSDTVTFLAGLSAPALQEMHAFCDMPPPPEHEVLVGVCDALRGQLDHAQVDMAFEALVPALRSAVHELQRHGHRMTAKSLALMPGFPDARVTEDTFTDAGLQATTRAAIELLTLAIEAPPAVHNGHVLHDVTMAALQCADAQGETGGVLCIQRRSPSIDFTSSETIEFTATHIL